MGVSGDVCVTKKIASSFFMFNAIGMHSTYFVVIGEVVLMWFVCLAYFYEHKLHFNIVYLCLCVCACVFVSLNLMSAE